MKNLQAVKKVWNVVSKSNVYTTLLLVVHSFSEAAIPFVDLLFYSAIVDELMAKNFEFAKLLVIYMVSITGILGIVGQICSKKINVIKLTVNESSERMITAKAMELEYQQFECGETKERLQKIKNYIQGQGGLDSTIEDMDKTLIHLFSTIFGFIFMCLLFVRNGSVSGVITCIIFIILMLVFTYLVYYISKNTEKAQVDMAEKNVHVNSVSQYVIMSSWEHSEEARLANLHSILDHYFEGFMKVGDDFLEYGKIAGRNDGIIALCTCLFTFVVYVYVAYEAMQGTISIGNIMLYAASITRCFVALSRVFSTLNMLVFRCEYLSDIDNFLNEPNFAYEGTLPIEKRSDNKYEIEFKNVSFHYPGSDKDVLKDVSLKFNIGEKMAMVGRNGAGKTTMVKLLCRLYTPSKGQILLNGIDIQKYDFKEYSKIFAPVFQDFGLLSIPLDENVYADMDKDEERLWDCLHKVGMDERVQGMDEKEHSLLYRDNGEGVNLSGGEAQKVAIARAIYKDAPFIILDEPTAALDPVAESEIYENFNTLIEDKTALYISHRMSSCKFCDRIVVFKDGEIVESGNHKELLEHNGEYANLYNAQAQYYV